MERRKFVLHSREPRRLFESKASVVPPRCCGVVRAINCVSVKRLIHLDSVEAERLRKREIGERLTTCELRVR